MDSSIRFFPLLALGLPRVAAVMKYPQMVKLDLYILPPYTPSHYHYYLGTSSSAIDSKKTVDHWVSSADGSSALLALHLCF